MNCLFCDDEITETNKTKEHIILDSLGGNLSSTNIICRKCNSEFGADIDIKLFSQLEFAAIYLGFSNNELEMQTLDGEELVVGASLVPYSRGTRFIPNSDKEVYFWKKDAEATEKELKKHLKQVTKKYPEFSLTVNNYTNQNAGKVFFLRQKNSPSPGFMNFGGDEYFRAICKMSVEFAAFVGAQRKYLIQAVAMVKGDDEIVLDFYYPTTYGIRKKSDDEISHLLYIKGDPDNKLLFVYSELFSFSNHLCILSSNYDDESFEHIYHFDLLNKKAIENTLVSIRLNRNFTTDGRVILKSMFVNNQKQQEYAFRNLMKQFEALQLLR